MSVVVAFEEAGPCRKKLTIEVPAPAVEAEVGRVVGEYRKEIQFPGFRKGKAPVHLIKRRFKADIDKEVADRLVPRYWHQAQAEKSLEPLLPPQVEDLTLTEGEPMRFVAVVEIRPDLSIGVLDDLELPEGEVEPRSDEIEDALRDLRRQHATWTTVERPAANGDLVIGTMEEETDTDADAADADDAAAEDDDAAEQAAGARPVHIELGGQGVEEKLTLALTGVLAGHKVKYSREETLGEGETKERHFRIVVEEVKEQELPELDDELATRFGIETAEELRQRVGESLQQGKERELRSKREQSLLEQLRERYPLELPEGLVQHESEQMVNDYLRHLESQGVDVDKAPINWEALLADVKPRAEKRVHERLILDAVAEHRGERLDEQAFEQFLAVAAAQQKMSSLSLRQQLAENGRLEPLRAQMLRDQTLRFLLGDTPDETEEDEDTATDDTDEPSDAGAEE